VTNWSQKIKDTEVALHVLGIYRRIADAGSKVPSTIAIGVSTFLGLSDTPNNFEAGKRLSVKSDGSGLEYTTEGMGTAVHEDNASYQRPDNFDIITWVGSVEPNNAADYDIWIQTP